MNIPDLRAAAPPAALGFRPPFMPARVQPKGSRGASQFHGPQQHLARQEPLAVLGEHAAMIVHELRSPLSTVAMALAYVAREDLPERALKRIEIARREEKRLDALVNGILHYIGPPGPAMARLGVNELLLEVIGIVSVGSGDEPPPAIDYHDAGQPIATWGDRDRLKQAFINLVTNACQAVPPHQAVHVSLEFDDPADALRVVIRNDGHIPPHTLERLGTPFYTTKPGGTGLGLPIVRRIVDAHDGFLDITSDPNDGVRVTVGLAMCRQARPAPARPGP